MLSARYLASCSDDIVRLYSQLESEIIISMAKRLKKLGRVTESTVYQARILNEIGGLRTEVMQIIQKYDAPAQKMILDLFNSAMNQATKSDLKNIDFTNIKMNDSQLQLLKATAEKLKSSAIINSNNKTRQDFIDGQAIKVFSGLQRLTMTIADSSSGLFVQKANQCYMEVTTGAFDYDTSFKKAVDELATESVKTVKYTDSGQEIHRSIESAVRTNIMSSINQTASQITINNCEELGTDLVEVSAHMGARPEHEEFQGKIYSLSGESKKYPPFSLCRLGEPTGICGINCRHSYYPYFEGEEPRYSKGELDEMKDSKVTYNNKTMTQYEGEQQLRLYERAIRKWKRQADTEKSVGLDDFDSRLKIAEWQKTAADFCRQTGLKRDYAREYIGTESGKQPKGLELPF